MKAKKTAPPPAPALPPQPLTERQQRAAMIPKFKDSTLIITQEQSDYMAAILHTDHPELMSETLRKSLAGNSAAAAGGDQAYKQMNVTLHHLAELKPTSYLETMLTCQMLQVSTAAARCMELAFHDTQTFAGKELNANLAIKFQRTFCAQVEALQKLRNSGKQKITVEHVTVQAGGQAVVGNVTHQGSRGEG